LPRGPEPAAFGLLRLLLNNAEFAHVTRDDAAEAGCFRYLCMFFRFVIANFRGVITRMRQSGRGLA
jgi:hypothetical protein